VGTYPTFLAGEVVVKLFGYFPSWRANHAAELAAQLLLRDHPGIPAPALLAAGQLYREPASEPWPYLVTERFTGAALRDASLAPAERLRVAGRLGAAVRRVHDLPAPAAGPLDRDWLRDHGKAGTERHRGWGSLPVHLVDQIDAYVVPPPPERRLVHADLTADHVFVAGGDLVGVIDWGDAMVTDPYYELGALHLGAFQGDRRMMRAFLTGYGWPVSPDFPRRAMSAALGHEFDLFAELPPERLAGFRTLEELATALWEVTAAAG
jgi:aminoglycoside phosphotransferase (APT) family kinase protein